MSVAIYGNVQAKGSVSFNPTSLVTNWIWAVDFVPSTTGFTDGSSLFLNLGVTFYSTSPGYIKSIRYYKDPNNFLAVTGSIWNSSGTELAETNFASTPSVFDGWVSQSLSTPLSISANTVYVASVIIAPIGGTSLRYYANNNYFDTTSRTNGPLVAVQDNVGFGRNGVYVDSPSAIPSFPTLTNNSGPNYWVDVLYSNSP